MNSQPATDIYDLQSKLLLRQPFLSNQGTEYEKLRTLAGKNLEWIQKKSTSDQYQYQYLYCAVEKD